MVRGLNCDNRASDLPAAERESLEEFGDEERKSFLQATRQAEKFGGSAA